MGLFRANAQCSYYLRIRGRFGGGPGGPSGLFARFLTPVLEGMNLLSLHWMKPLRKGALLEMVPRAAKC